MKNSGIEWIGEIPDDWELIKIGSIFACRNEKVSDSNYAPLSVSRGGVVPQMKNVAKSDAGDNRKLVLKEDFVINSRSDRKQSCGISSLDGSVSLINTVLYPIADNVICPQYTNLVMKNYGFAEEFYRWGHGIVADLWTTRWQEMQSIVLPIPPFDLQQQIADCLHKKCAAVERLIANQQEQIEKLKEYKQSVISEAVTKGLDSTVPMKDSGVEWINNIAMSHNIVRLKFLLKENMLYGANESGENTCVEGVRYIRITDITADGKLKNDENNQYLKREIAKNYMLSDKDILFARSGGTVGKTFMYRASLGDSSFAGYLIKATCNSDKLLPEYLMYYTQSSLYMLWKSMIFIQATIQNIGANKYSNMEVVLPNIEGQQQIADYLDKKCAEIDNLISIKQQKIEKLQEYKKSLIYEYVTGKKQVLT